MELEEIIEVLKSLDFSHNIWQIVTPLSFSLADIVTGYIQAIINKNIDSQKMRNGLLHKSLIIIILSFILSFTFNINYISKIVSIYIIAMELTSIIENLKKAGLHLGKLGTLVKEKTENSTEESLNTIVEEITKED
jgi:toxin secretion/phage lysis holin